MLWEAYFQELPWKKILNLTTVQGGNEIVLIQAGFYIFFTEPSIPIMVAVGSVFKEKH